jgi:hypothetical protein
MYKCSLILNLLIGYQALEVMGGGPGRGSFGRWWKNPEYPERTIDHGQATGKLYHLRCESSAPFCNLQSRAGIAFEIKD